jgi:ribosome-associated protein
MIQITPDIAINEDEVQFDFVRSSGPGGQNVNKVATAVELRFDAGSSSLPEDVRRRLASLARSRINKDGVLIIAAQRFRTQAANRQDALDRLVELIRKAAYKPPVRHKTRPTLASRQRRLETKRRRSATKQLRSQKPEINGDF